MAELLAKLLPIGLMLLMFVVGLRLEARHLGAVFRNPRALGIGLAVQLIGLPALAVLLAVLLRLPAPMAAGLVLVAAAPGGVTSNYIAHLARADLALSTAMTLVTTALASVTIPLVLSLAGAADLPTAGGLARISGLMVGVALVPMLLGMALSTTAPSAAKTVINGLEPASRIVFIAMVVATFIQNWGAMTAHFASTGAAVVALNLGALALAFGVGTLARLRRTQVRAIMVEASLQNVAVALFVAGAVLHDPAMSVPALIYAMVMNVTALAQILLGRARAGMAPA